MTLKHRTAALTLALTAALTLAGCGSDDDGAADPAPTPTTTAASPSGSTTDPAAGDSPSQEPSGTTIDITIDGDTITPAGERVKVDAGEPVTLHVVADRAGELHVHSAPEQELEYAEGESDLELTIDRPGIVEVEDHAADIVIVQLEVS